MTARLTCEQAVREFFAYLDGALSDEPLEALLKHLADCLDCCDRLEFSRHLDAFAKTRLGEVPLPQGLEVRLRQGLMRARVGDPAKES